MLTAATLRYTLGAATRVILLEGAPAKALSADRQATGPPTFAFPLQGSSPNFLVTRHQSEVCTLSGWVSPPLGGPIRPITGRPFAFSDILYPLCLPLSLRSGYHSSVGCGAHRAYPVDCCGDTLRLGWGLSPGGGFGCCCLRLTTDSPPHVTIPSAAPFGRLRVNSGQVWLRPISLFGRFRLTRCTPLHVCSTLRCFSGPPPPRG